MQKQQQHTHIRDLAALGHELPDEHLRLATGGLAAIGPLGRTNRVAPTYRDGQMIDSCTD